MKQIKFLGFLIISAMTFMSCGSDDSGDNILDPNNPNNPSNGISRIDFTIQGTDRNGSFSIVDTNDDEIEEISSSGMMYQSEEGSLVNFGYTDDIQGLNIGFNLSGGVGTYNLQSVSIEDGIYQSFLLDFNTSFPSNSNVYVAKNMTVVITEFETISLTMGAYMIKKVKGTFSGTVMDLAEMTGANQNTHTIEGSFSYFLYE